MLVRGQLNQVIIIFSWIWYFTAYSHQQK